jgi:predicted metalloprotease with PDZ domain
MGGLMHAFIQRFTVFASVVLLIALLPGCADYDGERVRQLITDDAVKALDAKIEVALITASDGKPRLKITESFVMWQDRVYVRFPNSFLRKERLYDRIENLTTRGEAKLYPYKNIESIKELVHKKGERVEFSYLYRPDDPINYNAEKESFSAPIIRDHYFQFIGQMAFIFPAGLEDTNENFSLTLSWAVPKDFTVFNSFGGRTTWQKLKLNCDKLRDALFVAGSNMRTTDIEVRGQPVTIAIEGRWPNIPDAEFNDVVGRLLNQQRKTWNDDNFPHFFVHFLAQPLSCKGGKFMGTAHTDSFRAVFPDSCKFEPEMKQLISHELMHMWIGKKIKVGRMQGHYDGKWFTEGWTDYFSRLLAYRAGVLSEDEYFGTLNRQLNKYYQTNEKSTTLRELVQRIYRRGISNRELEAVPYQQGEIMAWRLNKKIKEETSFKFSLDDVVRGMLKEVDYAGGVKNFTPEEIAMVVDGYGDNLFQEEMEKVVTGDVLIAPELPNCRASNKAIIMDPRHVSRTVLLYGERRHSCDRWMN